MIGKEKHEAILKLTIDELKNKGYHVIDLERLSPSAIATKNNKIYAIVVVKKVYDKKRYHWKAHYTLTELEHKYHMFDEIIRVFYKQNMESYDIALEQIKFKLENENFNFIKVLNNKSPDAIAIKNNLIFAIEILGLMKGYTGNFNINNKKYNYEMFDGLMIRTFVYGDDDYSYFTEYYGKNKFPLEIKACEG